MRITWDERKSRTNKMKHGFSFELATKVFDDPLHLSVQDSFENGEERWQTIGLVEGVVIILVAHTYSEAAQGPLIRIISARKATRQERIIYEKENFP